MSLECQGTPGEFKELHGWAECRDDDSRIILDTTKFPRSGICIYCHSRVVLVRDLIPGHPPIARYGGRVLKEGTIRKCLVGGYPPREALRALIAIQGLEVWT